MLRRNTKQRQLVLDTVQGRCDHPTAEQIYNEVSKKDNSVSRGTVYRNLSILIQNDQIKSINLPEASHYDLRTDKHNHFVCEKCGKVCDIEIKYDSSIDNMELCGFKINSHETIFKGLCPDCYKKQNLKKV